jgi:ribosomal protein L11 methylase PrmA
VTRSDPKRVAGSFRDPSGHVYTDGDRILRSVTDGFAGEFVKVVASGLLDVLVERGLMVAFEEIDASELASVDPSVRIALRVERIPFVSQPREWCFSQLKDAALLTLELQRLALQRGMVLKDASAHNVQFVGCRPVFIDLLSFEPYQEGAPWVAYRQFCEHFLGPLALAGRIDPRLISTMLEAPDGIPLDLASRTLPASTWASAGLLAHVHLHARSQKRYAGTGGSRRTLNVSKTALLGLVESLDRAIRKMDVGLPQTEWSDYYDATNYSAAAMQAKCEAVEGLVADVRPDLVWDLGANTGRFSDLCCSLGAYTVAFDVDHGAIERAYRSGRDAKRADLLPLVADLTAPTPSSGWGLAERPSLFERGRPDLVLGLALVHHLAIANNVPLPDVAGFFASLAPHALVEWVPKEDSQVQRLLASREDVFPGYTQEGFVRAFGSVFDVSEVVPIEDTGRALYHFIRKDRRA